MILKLSALALCVALTMSAQELVQPNLDGFKYPRLAQAARIQGTVQFVVKSEGIQLLAGHPMLVPAARTNLEEWAVPYASSTPLSVTYSFRLAPGARIVEVDQPVGDRLDRFFLRLFHRPTTRRIKGQDCLPYRDSPVRVRNETKDGLRFVEIDIEAMEMCLETDVVAIAALRH